MATVKEKLQHKNCSQTSCHLGQKRNGNQKTHSDRQGLRKHTCLTKKVAERHTPVILPGNFTGEESKLRLAHWTHCESRGKKN